ncbi:hypothetical protein [Thermogemmatispora sp.]|uniref:hypothetical protein n=1 Tax=Thermogemmatispora sp. TaxID=1968838 RepID=UPI001E199216|nr:hypothetical protein [Thermogemmatispora sp.]MBX5450252.1 hypothetical protein [Thermogemmatispora sp.]
MALDAREGWQAISAPLAARFGHYEQAILQLIEQAYQEWNQLHLRPHFAVAYGQKPLPS